MDQLLNLQGHLIKLLVQKPQFVFSLCIVKREIGGGKGCVFTGKGLDLADQVVNVPGQGADKVRGEQEA